MSYLKIEKLIDSFTMNKIDIYSGLFVLLSVLLILAATLFPYDFDISDTMRRQGYQFLFVGLGESSLMDIRNNILLFVPFGFSLAWLKKKNWITGWPEVIMAASAGFVLSYLVEVGQTFIHTRYSSLVDVFANTTGGTVGYLSFQLGKCVLQRSTAFVTRKLQ